MKIRSKSAGLLIAVMLIFVIGVIKLLTAEGPLDLFALGFSIVIVVIIIAMLIRRAAVQQRIPKD